MDKDEQRKACRDARLFSRVEPAHKSKIVGYLQEAGAVSAMVGRQHGSMKNSLSLTAFSLPLPFPLYPSSFQFVPPSPLLPSDW